MNSSKQCSKLIKIANETLKTEYNFKTELPFVEAGLLIEDEHKLFKKFDVSEKEIIENENISTLIKEELDVEMEENEVLESEMETQLEKGNNEVKILEQQDHLEAGPSKKRKTSSIWEHFENINDKKVACLLCKKVLGYNKNTSSLLRHYRAIHEKGSQNINPNISIARKKELDDALVAMIVKDTQPFSIVEDQGFRDFVAKLDPTYVLPTRKAVKTMVKAKYEEEKKELKKQLKNVRSVSLTTDMWTWHNLDAYLAITCHYINEQNCLSSSLLGLVHSPQNHTAVNLASAIIELMNEWGISSKVNCLVTDGATNMIACGKMLKMHHSICVAHMLNSIVKKSLDMTESLTVIRSKARRIVGYFCSSTSAKEKLGVIQQQMGMPVIKLIQEIETRWNSTYNMFKRLVDQREFVGAALAGLATDIPPLSSEEYSTIIECLGILSPLNDATIELSEEKTVSASKTIPLLGMVKTCLQDKIQGSTNAVAKHLGEHLMNFLREKLCVLETSSVNTLSTLLDPRFKTLGFLSSSKADEAIKRLTAECAALIKSEQSTKSTSTNNTDDGIPGNTLWDWLDEKVKNSTKTNNVTANATIEVQRYLSARNILRSDDPLEYWDIRKDLFPTLYNFAIKYLCIPASSVPCERVFSKAGETLSIKRNRLKPKTAEILLFLNKN